MGESILLESGERVIVAVPLGEPCVFNKPRLEFARPRWTDDGAATQCLYCKHKFTQLRRKHHCRSCGRLFCSKCCNDKTVLTHLGISELERTCAICKPILSIMTNAFSHDVKLRTDAAASFQNLIQETMHMQEVVELGGMHTLVWLCGTNSAQMYKHAVPALHNLATQASLQKYLLQAGIVQALSSILESLNPSDKLTTDCISTLLILSKGPEAVQQVIESGGLSCLLTSITRVDELTRLLTLQAVMRMSSVAQSHSAIMSNMMTVKYLTSLTASSQDPQVLTLLFKIFGEISAGQSLAHKVILAEEETTSAYMTKSLLKGQTNELRSNILCLLANLAATAETQVHLATIVAKLGDHLADATSPCYRHALRLLTNLSVFSQHCYKLMSYIPMVLTGMRMISDQQTQNLSLLFLANLLNHSAEDTSEHISRAADGKVFLTRLMQITEVSMSITDILNRKAIHLSRPS